MVTSPAGRRVQASVEGGSYGTAGVSARGAYTHSTWSNALSAGYRRSDGATENSDFQQTRAFYQGRYAHPDLRADWQIGVSTQDYGANTFYSAAYPNQWEATRRYSAATKSRNARSRRLTPTLSWLRSTDHFQLVRGTPAGENFHRSDVFTAGLRRLDRLGARAYRHRRRAAPRRHPQYYAGPAPRRGTTSARPR